MITTKFLRFLLVIVILIILILWSYVTSGQAQAPAPANQVCVALTLDASGSMQTNDPSYLSNSGRACSFLCLMMVIKWDWCVFLPRSSFRLQILCNWAPLQINWLYWNC